MISLRPLLTTSSQVTEMAHLLTIRTFQKGECIMQQGEEATWVGVLLSGRLSVTISGEHIANVNAGQTLGEIEMFSQVLAEPTAVNRWRLAFKPAQQCRLLLISSASVNHIHSRTRRMYQATIRVMHATPKRVCGRIRPCAHRHNFTALREALLERRASLWLRLLAHTEDLV